MKTVAKTFLGAIAALALMPTLAQAEILAMMNYESKTEDSLKALQIQGAARERREGIAVMDIDPSSENFGKILMDIPLPPDLVAHHMFYNRDAMTYCGIAGRHLSTRCSTGSPKVPSRLPRSRRVAAAISPGSALTRSGCRAPPTKAVRATYPSGARSGKSDDGNRQPST